MMCCTMSGVVGLNLAIFKFKSEIVVRKDNVVNYLRIPFRDKALRMQ